MKRLPWCCAILFAVGSVPFGGIAYAATYYVATGGSDSVSCATARNIATPRRTIANAVGCLVAGDTLLVRGGTYVEMVGAGHFANSGTSWSNKIRVAAYPNGCASSCETVWIRPSSGTIVLAFNQSPTRAYIEFDGINFNGSLVTGTVVRVHATSSYQHHHIRFQNFELIGRGDSAQAVDQDGMAFQATASHQGGHEILNCKIHQLRSAPAAGGGGGPVGLYIAQSNVLVDGCEIYDYRNDALQTYNSDTSFPPTNVVIRNNRIHDPTTVGVPSSQNRTGMSVWHGSGHLIYNNLVYNIPGTGYTRGIDVNEATANVKVYSNTVYNVAGVGIDNRESTAQIRNNISYGSGTNFSNSGGGTTSNNLFSTNPLFVNAGAGDFHLAGSPAIDAGVTLSEVPTDFDRVSRPQGTAYDIGAYELASSGGAPSAPTQLRVIGN